MKLSEVHEQLSPEPEMCDLCVQEGKPGLIPPCTPYHWVGTTDGMFYDLCDDHYYQIATLQ